MQTESTDRKGALLSQRFFRQIAGVSVGLLILAGAIEGWFGYQEVRHQISTLQALQARAAQAEIGQYLQSIVRQVAQVQSLPWGQPAFGTQQRREELHRLLALAPSIVELADFDANGRELLAVSRAVLDRVDSGHATAGPRSGSNPSYGAPYFDDAGAPNVRLSMRRAGEPAVDTVATVNLRFLGEVVSGLRVPGGGEVYVVDGNGQLIAHADPTQALRQLRVKDNVSIAAADHALSRSNAELFAIDGLGLHGTEVIASAVRMPSTGWLIFVEQPRDQAMQPVSDTLKRTLVLLAIAAVLATLTSATFARRMAAPIARLREASANMAAGHLEQRLVIRTGDEIEGLAEDFNTMSARLQQSYRELEQKVVERTAELALRRDEAERANAAKTRFLASASHDLRQPMHAIGLLVGVLRERLAEQDLRGLADKTHQAVQAMEELFNSLLDVSKLDAGAIQPQPRTFALQDLLLRVSAAYAPLASAKGIRLRVHPTRAMVHTDPALLERVVGNLVTNAIRYTRRGGVLVGCRRRGQGWVLQVVDSGIGIAADQLDLIFEEFVRLGDATTGEQGLGLGLAIVRRTAALLDLQVQVRSRPGRGSTFELSLPLAHGLPSVLAPLSLSPDLHQRVQGAFVLVVDDDAGNLQATAALLRQWGCLVATAATAQEALNEADAHLRPPDALITDLRLGPGPHGMALIQHLRQKTGTRTPALLVTADTRLPQPLDDDTGLLQKPVGAARLLEALAQSLVGAPSA